MPRYRCIVAYDGTNFHGWQKQGPPNGRPLRTVQGVFERAAIKALRETLVISGASRTDSGVHAKGQVAVFTSTRDIEPERILLAVNSKLPGDVQITAVDVVHKKFDPITDCVAKGYRYTFAHGCSDPRRKPLFDRHYITYTAHPLAIKPMQEAAKLFEGEHDFVAFTRPNHGRDSTIRRIDNCTIHDLSEWRIAIDVSGNGFLWNMVRIIAGTLHEVGRGRILPADIPELIAAGDRCRTGKTMPPQGLSLEWVQFATS